MDNICHTLVGAAMAEAGLKRGTAFGAATLMIGANLPDIDVLAVPFGHSVDFRRGWTHGVLALVVLPFILTAIMLMWDRLVSARRRPAAGAAPADRAVPRRLLLLSFLAILTHPTLDWMNEYGMRWLMPFSNRWFYGDTLFIVDPWLWLALGLGVVLARRRGPGPARVALGVATAYVAAMFVVSAAGRRVAQRELASRSGPPASRLMVSASFAHPLRKRVLVDDGSQYRSGTLSLGSSAPLAIERIIDTNEQAPEAASAAVTPRGQRFLVWSRFPFYVIERGVEGPLVRIADARYSFGRRGGDWASVEIRLPETRTQSAATVLSRAH